MLSTLAIVSIFIEIFIAGILISGAITFFRFSKENENRKDAFLAFVLLFFALKTIFTIISQMAFNLGRPLSELMAINRFVSVDLVVTVFFVWLFLLTKFKIKKVRWVTWSTIFLSLVSLLGVFRILISDVNLAYREDVIEPLVTFSYPVPLKFIWFLIWLALAVAYFWRARLSKSGRRQLSFLGGFGALAILCTPIITNFYSGSGQSIYLLVAWLFTLFGVIAVILAELIPADSKAASNPLVFFRTRILFKLLLIIVLLIVILFEATTLVTIAISKRSLSQAIMSVHREVAGEVRDAVDRYVDSSVELLRFVAGSGGGMLQAKSVLDMNRNFDAICVVSRNGQVGPSVSRDGAISLKEIDWKEVSRQIGEQRFFVGGLLQDRNGKELIFMGVPLSGGNILMGQINFVEIQALIEKLSSRGKQVICLVDQDGKLVLHADEVQAKSRADYSDSPLVKKTKEGKEGTGEFYDKFGDKVVGASLPLENLGWGVLVTEPIGDAYFPLRTLETNSLLLVITGIIITLLVGYYFARSIERPIKDVISGTEAIRKGDLSFRIPLETQDEIGELAMAFNQMTSELRESQDRLILSEKLASLGTMAAGMAHEIKNPLVSLRTFTQLLPQKWQDPEYREKFSAIVPQEIERINKIAESLLKFGRPIKPELTKVEVNLVLEEVILLFESECKKNNIRITTKFAALPQITADASQLSQAFVNITLNAIQVMHNGGELTFKTDVG
ncbi:MAG: cache domain-containing protein, partial [Candidatus Saganbacteria bacterium]|nr:cache domain-containing protein [Candidatus Saganbacteria bacterium]